MKKKFNIIGMMSGTSMDAINVTFVQSDGINLKRHNVNVVSNYSKETKTLLKQILLDYECFSLNKILKRHLITLITYDHFKAAKKAINKATIKPDLIGFHGQTIYHNPQKKISIQLGDSQLLSNLLKTNVVSNFRDSDLFYGGEGAPLAPIYHQLLMEQLNLSLPSCFLNIGGISNLTFWDGHDLIGFDTGPGNCMMDEYIQKKLGLDYDNGGKLASEGHVNLTIKNQFLNHPYFTKTYPKSLDRQEFNHIIKMIFEMNLTPPDAMATLAECTIISIFNSLKFLPLKPKNLIIMGGGVHNLFLLGKLKNFNNINVYTAKEKNIPGDFIEAELIAFLAARNIFKLPITFPNTTGTKKPLSGGKKFLYN